MTVTPDTPAGESPVARGGMDPEERLQLAMPVKGSTGRAFGKVAAWHHDALTGRMIGFTVQHGVLRQRYTRMRFDDVASVSNGTLVLTCSRSAFAQLPGCDAPMHSAQPHRLRLG